MTAPLLEIRNLCTWFPVQRGIPARTVDYVKAVDDVSLTVAPGETLGLVGESGCGKSTLARSVLMLETPCAGSILFEGRDLTSLRRREKRAIRQHLQIVFQDPFASLNPRMTVLDIVTEALVEHQRLRRRDRDAYGRQLLADVGMGADALNRYPHEFSGGQRQRISIARALSLRPKLLICDEAVSALDVSVQAQVMNLLDDLRTRYGLAYLFIAHDISVVRHISHRIAVMYQGKLVETGNADEIVLHPQHPYTRELIAAVPTIEPPATKKNAGANN